MKFGIYIELIMMQSDKNLVNSIHRNIRKIKPQPSYCEVCKIVNKRLDLSFKLSHAKPEEYTLNPDDYTYRCSKCHRIQDGTALKAQKLITEKRRNKTYEEYFGKEKALELKKERAIVGKKNFEKNGNPVRYRSCLSYSYPEKHENVKCLNCGIFFNTCIKLKRKFCSHKCHGLFYRGKKKPDDYRKKMSKLLKGRPSKLKGTIKKEHWIEKICIGCNKSFSKQKCQKRKYCSNLCYQQHRRKKVT